jgi:glycine betaine/proline transport system ATP-binding protein
MEQAIVSARNGVARAEEIVQQECPSTSPDTPVEQVLPLVAEGNIPVAVLDEETHLLGVITRSALIEAMQLGNGDGNEK